jgi:hypothetical protein
MAVLLLAAVLRCCAVLYIPFLLPFVAASLVTLLVHRKDLEVHWTVPIKEAFQRIAGEGDGR